MKKETMTHTFTRLYLEIPDRYVYSNAQWATCFFELVHSEL